MARSLVQVAPELWVAQSRLYDTNSGIFLSQGQACLVDPAVYPDEIETIARFVAGHVRSQAAVQALVLTHSHWDHILGPERFPGVPVVAQAAYRTEVEGEQGARTRQELTRWEAESGVVRRQPFTIPLPSETFEGQRVLAVGGLVLRLVHAPGHAADQLVVYQPEGAVLWAADMLSDLEIPFVSHSLAAYETTLATLAAFEVRVLVPGHGHPTADAAEIRSRLLDDAAYLAVLHELVQRAIRQGRTLKETAELCSQMQFRNPEQNARPHRLNVESTYQELGGAAGPQAVGWDRAA